MARRLFILDGLGALLSAFMLGVVLVHWQHLVGIPKPTLYVLAAIPCFFAVYDACCYFKAERNLGRLLAAIGIANVLYCVFSLGLAYFHYEQITPLGWVYIIVEILIVVGIAFSELRVAKRHGELH